MTMLVPFRDDWKDFPCVEWKGVCNYDGYGQTSIGGLRGTIHRLTWIWTKGPIPDGYCVMHACDNRICYAIEHLGLGTQQDNSNDKYAKGRANTAIGSRHGMAKLTEADVVQIKLLLALPNNERLSNREIGEQFGVTDVMISFIKQGRSWSHVTTDVDSTISKIPRETKGIRNPMSTLTEDNIIDIKSLLALPDGERPSHREIGEMYGVAQSHITNISSGKRWAHIVIGCQIDNFVEEDTVIAPHKPHSEVTKEKIRNWRVENREGQNINNSRRQQRRFDTAELSKEDRELTVAHRKAIKNDLCFYCGERTASMHDDHMTPFSRGGTDQWWNIVRACSDCNNSKGSMTADEFIERLRNETPIPNYVSEVKRLLALPNSARPPQHEIAKICGTTTLIVNRINTGKLYPNS